MFNSKPNTKARLIEMKYDAYKRLAFAKEQYKFKNKIILLDISTGEKYETKKSQLSEAKKSFTKTINYCNKQLKEGNYV